jgi:predicted PurR-regulated permease PerM
VVVATGGLAIALPLVVWSFSDVFLLAFGSVLGALLLRSLVDIVRSRTGVSEGTALALVLAVLSTVMALGAWLLAARVSTQTRELVNTLPQGAEELRRWAAQFSLLEPLVEESRTLGDWLMTSSALRHLTSTVSTVVGVAVDALVVAVVSLYLAANPTVYVEGFLQLIPPTHRARLAGALGRLGSTLRWWIVGRIGLMALNTIVTAVGLWLLGVPLALTLGLLSGLLNFIPNIGPLLAATPAVLIALTQSPTQALYVVLLYVIYQSVDGYILTPVVTQRTVSVPPAVTLLAQVLLGASVGLYGLLLASPLVAAVLVTIRVLYVEDVLRDARESQPNTSDQQSGP